MSGSALPGVKVVIGHDGFWADTKSAIVRCISLEGIESTRTAGSLMKLVFLELRLDNLQYQLPELVGQGFK